MYTEKERFAVFCHSFLRADGTVEGDFPRDISPEDVKEWYRVMVLARAFNEKALELQKLKKLGTYPSSEGQEAATVGYASAMQPEDIFLAPYREFATQIMRAETPEEGMTKLFLFWGGDERGCSVKGSLRDYASFIPICSQTGIAVGDAMATRILHEKCVTVCVLGDGATSKGDFSEALKWAGVYHLPIVFIVVNNQWAISVPRERQAGAVTLAQNGIAAGIRQCYQVDGNDIVAMHSVVQTAIRRAREGKGASVIEALTYRLGNHTTADDAARYRLQKEVDRARAEDPLIRTRTYLVNTGVWDDKKEADLWDECRKRVEESAAEYLRIIEDDPQPATAMFDHLHAELPEALEVQRKEVSRLYGGAS